MPSLYRKLRRPPLPPGSKPETRKGVAGVRWTDGRGRERWAPAERGRLVIRDVRWTIQYTDIDGRVREMGTRTADRKLAEELLAALTIKLTRQRAGIVDESEINVSAHAKRPLIEHLNGAKGLLGFRDRLADKRDSAGHVDDTVRRIERVLTAAKIDRIPRLETSKVANAIAGLKRKDGNPIGGATVNAYIRSMRSFSAWLSKSKRAREDFLRDLEFVKAEPGRTLRRREITPAEFEKIVTAAKRSPTVTIEERAGGKVKKRIVRDRDWAYRIAWGSGFRAREIASLTPESFATRADPPTVRVQAGYAKGRRMDVQPISPKLARMLEPWLKRKPKGKPLFAGWERWGAAIKADARAAGVAVNTPDGTIDFHALRHSYASRIAAVADSKTGQSLTRHTTAQLYLTVYAKERAASRAKAVRALDLV